MTKDYSSRNAHAASPIPISLKYLPALALLWVCLTGKAQGTLQNDLVACYAFSGNASDGSGNNHDGTPNGPSLMTDRFGNPNSAYHFDGVDDYITLPENALRTSNYAYSFWAKAASLPALLESYAVLSVGGPGADQGVTLSHGYVGGSTGWSMVSYNADGSYLPSNSVGSLPATNTWYHVVQTRSSTSVDLYVNGALVGSRATGGATVGYNYNTPGATIGCRTNLIQFFHGAIDDVRIYNRAVTAAEATALFQTNLVCQPPVDLQTGLIGCYPFSGNANNAGGSGNNGTVNGAVLTTDRFGNANSAYAFDGINDHIELVPAPFLNSNYTYSAWVKLPANPVSGSAYIFFSVGGVNADQNLSLNNFNAASAMGWTVGGSNTDGSAQHYSTGSLPAPNAWTHLAMTRDNNTIRLFVNGQLTGSVSTYGRLPLYNTGAARAVIGARSHDLNQYTKGTIDDVALYNRALSAAEVTALFNGSACGAPPVTVPVPVAADVARCENGPVTLTALGGSEYRWYQTATGDAVLHTGASFTTPALTATTKYYVANVVNGQESTRKEVSAIITPIPAAPVTADTSRCGNGTLTLTASGCHNYRWYDAQGALLGSGLTFTTPVLSKTTTFFVSGVHNECEGPRTPLKVTVRPLPSTPLVTASGPTAFCAGDSVVLSATPGCATYRWSNGETSQSIVVREPGSYSVQTTNFVCNSCDRYTCESLPSKPVVVKVHDLPAAPEIVQVCADTLRALPAGKVFAWYRDGVLLPFTSRSILAEQTGSYTVKVRDTNGCFSEPSTPYAFTPEPATFTVYPNPNQGSFQVKVNGSHKVLKLEIVTLREGKLLWKTELPHAECRLNVSINLALPKGIYLVKLHTRKGVLHQRVQIL